MVVVVVVVVEVTHQVSVSDGDVYTQLNQYRLKDETG